MGLTTFGGQSFGGYLCRFGRRIPLVQGRQQALLFSAALSHPLRFHRLPIEHAGGHNTPRRTENRGVILAPGQLLVNTLRSAARATRKP